MNKIFIQDNIYLRFIKLEDASVIYQTINREREYLREWLPFVDATEEEFYTQTFVQSSLDAGRSEYVIFDQENFVGLIGFNNMDAANRKAEIGYWISQHYQGRGIVTNSVKKMVQIAFTELKMNSVRIKVAVGNSRSRKIPEKLGFRQEGVERDGELLVNNRFTDLVIYSMLKSECKILK